MVDPFTFGSDFGLTDPYVPRRRRFRQPETVSPLPDLTPEEAEGILARAGRAAYGGLEALGNVLDTPGSFVRGVLAGEPGRAFSGILDPSQRVSGRDLLENYGLAVPNQEGLFNSVGDFLGDVGGFGLEIATDPLSYFGLSALTQAGKGAQKTGKLAQLTNQAGRSARSYSAPIRAGYSGLGSMFGKPVWTGEKAADFAAKYLDPAAEAVKYGKWSPVRPLRGLFSAAAGDTSDPWLQKLHEYTFMPAKEALEAKAREKSLQAAKLGRTLGVIGNDDLMRQSVDVAEGIMVPRSPEEMLQEALAGAQDELLQAGLSPNSPEEEKALADMLGQMVGERLDKMSKVKPADATRPAARFGRALAGRGKGELALERAIGLQTEAIEDYLPRFMNEFLAKKRREKGLARGAKSSSLRYTTSHRSQVSRAENLVNLGRNTIDDMVRDPKLVGSEALQELDERAAHIQKTFFTKDGQRIGDAQAQSLASWTADPDFGGSKLYDEPLVTSHTRSMFSARARAAGHTVLEGLSQRAFPVAEGVIPPNGAVPLREVLEKARLGYNKMDETGRAIEGSLAAMARKMNVDPAEIASYYVDADTAAKLTKYAQAFTVPESLDPFLAALDGIQNLSKSYLTQPFPSYHFRNIAGGMFQNFTDDAGYQTKSGLRDYLSPVRDAMKMLKGESIEGANLKWFGGELADDAEATRKLAEEMFIHRAAGPSGFDEVRSTLAGYSAPQGDQLGKVLPGEAGWIPNPTFRQTLKEAIPKNKAEANPLGIRGWGGDLSKETTFAPIKAGEKWTSKVEFLTRASHYLAKRAEMDASIAAAATRRAHFDYSKLSKFERSVARRATLFYSFSRQNLPYQVEQLLKNPRKMAVTVRAIGSGDNEEGFSPGYIQESVNIPWPWKSEGGVQSYVTGLGLPIEDAFSRFKFGDRGTQRTMQSWATMLRPEVRLPLEWLSGEQMMTGRPLDRVDPLLGRIATNTIETLGGPKVDPHFLPQTLEQVVSASPLSRALGSARQVVDPRKHDVSGMGRLGLNLLTGVRTEDVEPEQMRAEAMRSLLESLTGERSVGIRQIPYLRKDREQPGDVLQRFAAYKQEAERAKQLRESQTGIESRP